MTPPKPLGFFAAAAAAAASASGAGAGAPAFFLRYRGVLIIIYTNNFKFARLTFLFCLSLRV